jgi:hypothetical protein
MSQNQPRNITASVRQRLRNAAQTQHEDFQNLLTRYALERLLYRLHRSEHQDRFIIKGAILFTLWSNEPHRATRDLDLLCWGDHAIAHLELVFQNLDIRQLLATRRNSLRVSRSERYIYE